MMRSFNVSSSGVPVRSTTKSSIVDSRPRYSRSTTRESTISVSASTARYSSAVPMSQPDYHRAGADRIKADRQRAEAIEHELAAKFERWSELEARATTGGRAATPIAP